MKNVLIVRPENAHFNQLWAAHYLYNCLNRILGYKGYLFCTNSPQDSIVNHSSVFPLFRNNIILCIRNFWSVLRIVNPNIVHISGHYFALVLLIAAKLYNNKIKVVFDIRSLTNSRWRNKYYFFISRFFDHTFCLSNEIMDLVVSKDKSLLPVGFDGQVFYPHKGDRKKICLFYGSIVSKRKICLLIEAIHMAYLRSDYVKQFKFVFIGPCPESELSTLLQEDAIIDYRGTLGIEELGVIARSAMFGLAFVPNDGIFKNNLPLKTVEMLACGMQVLATNTEGNKLVTNLLNRSLLAEDSPKEYAEGIINLLNKTDISHHDRCVVSSSVSRFEWNRICKDYLIKVYDRL